MVVDASLSPCFFPFSAVALFFFALLVSSFHFLWLLPSASLFPLSVYIPAKRPAMMKRPPSPAKTPSTSGRATPRRKSSNAMSRRSNGGTSSSSDKARRQSAQQHVQAGAEKWPPEDDYKLAVNMLQVRPVALLPMQQHLPNLAHKPLCSRNSSHLKLFLRSLFVSHIYLAAIHTWPACFTAHPRCRWDRSRTLLQCTSASSSRSRISLRRFGIGGAYC